MTRSRTWTGRVFIGVSLDGYIARPDGDIGWLTDPPAGREHAAVESSRHAESWDTFFPAVDHVVMGRGTYDTVAAFEEWPYAGKTVVVLSTTLPVETGQDERVVVSRSLDDALAVLDSRGAKQVYVDGGRVVQLFLREGLIDEITTSWAPVLLGEGRPLFGRLEQDLHLSLRATHATEDGMVHATYRVCPEGRRPEGSDRVSDRDQ